MIKDLILQGGGMHMMTNHITLDVLWHRKKYDTV